MTRAIQAVRKTRLLALAMGALLATACGHLPSALTSAQAASRGLFRAAASDGAYSLFSQPDGSGRAAIFGAIDGAQAAIDITEYQLQNHDMVDHLVQAALRGVAIRVLYEPDPHYFQPSIHRSVPRAIPEPLQATEGVSASDLAASTSGNDADLLDSKITLGPGAVPDYTSTALALKDLQARTAAATTQVAAFVADDSHFALTHEKAMVVDGHEALIMTNNFTSAGLGPNREYGVIDRDPGEVAEVEAIFQADVQHKAYQPAQANLVVSPDDNSGQGNARTKLTALIASATKSIRIEDEEFADPQIARLLDQKAAAGVTVQLLVDPSDHTKSQPWFSKTGVKPMGWAPPNPAVPGRKAGMHAKLIVVDDAQVYLGSINLSFQSIGYNRELGILLSDPTLVRNLSSAFQSDWATAGLK